MDGGSRNGHNGYSLGHVVGLVVMYKFIMKKKHDKKHEIVVYDESNYKSAKGMPIPFNDDGKMKTCFLAAVDLAIGLVIKDENDPDPDNHMYCYRTEEEMGLEKNLKLDVPAILKRLNHFSQFENSGKYIYYDDFLRLIVLD